MIVTRVIPVVWSDAWGSGGLSVDADTDVTPLMRAADAGDLGELTKLLATGADVNARDWLGRSALLHACEHAEKNPSVVKALLAAGADVNAADHLGETPLLGVSGFLPAEVAFDVRRELLAAGADVNASNGEGTTPLMMAAATGDVETVKLLLKARARVNMRSATGKTALSLGEQFDHRDVVRLLRQAGRSDE